MSARTAAPALPVLPHEQARRLNGDWHLDAACRGMDAWPHYPPDGARGHKLWRLEEQAKQICADCPVIAQCREAGRTERYGIWGGLTAEERGWDGRGQRRREVAA